MSLQLQQIDIIMFMCILMSYFKSFLLNYHDRHFTHYLSVLLTESGHHLDFIGKLTSASQVFDSATDEYSQSCSMDMIWAAARLPPASVFL